MNPVILSYFGERIQNLPPEVFDILSLVLLVVLVVAIIVGVMGVISSLLDIAMYAVFIAVGIGGFFFLTDYINVSGALQFIADVITWLLNMI